uniref:Uncharacterized protein n=1 Tax=Oryza sativa subsp. japonica TaxID=39947 RepID=Q10P62_ORYSJ|nr:hypothetical protein LOC_Os03g14160 [Oryza sativa Japonica Group]
MDSHTGDSDTTSSSSSLTLFSISVQDSSKAAASVQDSKYPAGRCPVVGGEELGDDRDVTKLDCREEVGIGTFVPVSPPRLCSGEMGKRMCPWVLTEGAQKQ